MPDNRLGELPWLIDTTTGRPNGVRTERGEEIGVVTQDPRTGVLYAGGVPVSEAGISSADLATTAGIAGAMYQLSDGPNKGAKLTWAIPEGATEPTWCWWLWPQAAYSA